MRKATQKLYLGTLAHYCNKLILPGTFPGKQGFPLIKLGHDTTPSLIPLVRQWEAMVSSCGSGNTRQKEIR